MWATIQLASSPLANKNGQHRYCEDGDWDVLDGDAHWRHLVNTIEPSVCGGDAALCQHYCDHLFRPGDWSHIQIHRVK